MKIMRKQWFLFVMIFVLGACQESGVQVENSKPEPFIEPEKFISIMVDMHLAESIVSLKRDMEEAPVTKFEKLEYNIFKKYEIDSTTYLKNYEYYTQDLDLTKEIYQAVYDTLLMRQKYKYLGK
jgi:hypothetical protein